MVYIARGGLFHPPRGLAVLTVTAPAANPPPSQK
jgi:hypothetical protein